MVKEDIIGILTVIFLIISLLFNTSNVNSKNFWWADAPPPIIHNKQMPESWWLAIKIGSKKYGSNPFNVAAVMWIEMGGWKAGPVRKKSRFIGPCGFNKHCKKVPRDIMYTPEKQVIWACRLLRGNLSKRLKKYNKKWYKNNYIRDVKRLSRQLERQAKLAE